MNASIDIPEEGACADIATPPHAGAPKGPGTEEERTLLGIRQARDLVLAKNRELIDKLAHAEDQIAELTYARDDLATANEAAAKTTTALESEIAELRAQVSRLTEDRAAMSEVEQVYVLARTEIEADLLALAGERDSALETIHGQELELARMRAEIEAAHSENEASRQLATQLEDARRELAETRDAQSSRSVEHEEAIARLAGRATAAEQACDDSQREVARLASERDALQKQATAAISALEARLAALPTAAPASAVPSAPQKKKAATAPATGKVVRLPGPPPPVVAHPPARHASIPTSEPTPPAAPAAPPLTDQQLRSAIEAIHHQFEAVQAAPETLELLAKFDRQMRQLAESAHANKFDLIHHICSAGCEFTSRLQTSPARLAAALPVLEKTVEMLGWLGLRGRAAMIDANDALVYAVDDDVDNCECIATAFEKIALQTKYSVRPEIALEQIPANPCELIVLDVDLPGMDGFEVHARIRKMAGRETIPIIFLSGHLSTSERLAALGDENAEFVAKPYNLSELSLRVLTRIVEARLG